MTNARLLVAEDDPDIAEVVVLCLEGEGFQVQRVADGTAALEEATRSRFDLVLLDVRLPGMDGLGVCRELRRRSIDVPVLMLSARHEVLDRVLGLEVGADDYLGKPFDPRELVARVRALLRRVRSGPPEDGSPLRHGDLVVDRRRHRAELAGQELVLTPIEFGLLEALLERRGQVLTRRQLLDRVWGEEFAAEERTVDTHVAHLRRKLATAGGLIASIRGVGYRLG